MSSERIQLGIGERGPQGVQGQPGESGAPGITATFRGPYNALTSYTAGPPPDVVKGSDNNWYVSQTTPNLGHDPVTDGGVNWVPFPVIAPAVVADSRPHGATAGRGLDYNGSVFVIDDRRVDVWNASPNPAAVTDWRPIITAIAQPLYLGPHDFPFTTSWNIARTGQSIIGAGGVVNPFGGSGSQPKTRLIWKGGGSGIAFDFAGSPWGTVLRDLGICYDQTTGFTGKLVGNSAGEITGPTLEDCFLGPLDQLSTLAFALFSAHQMNNPILNRCKLRGAQYLVRGYDSVAFADQIRMRDCTVATASVAALSNFQSAIIDGLQCDTTDFPYIYYDDATASSEGNNSIEFRGGNAFDVVTPPFVGWIKSVNPQIGFILKMSGFNGHTGSGTVIDLSGAGAGTIEIDGCSESAPAAGQAFLDLGVIAGSVGQKRGYVRGNHLVNNDQADQFRNRAGHAVEVYGNDLSNKMPSQQFVWDRPRTVFYSTPTFSARPSIAAHAGSGANNQHIYGTDHEGFLVFKTAAGATGTGLQLDITFAKSLFSPPNYPFGGEGKAPIPCIDLTPMEVPEYWAGGAGANSGGLGHYASVASTMTGWSLGLTTPPSAAGNWLAFKYRVTCI